MCAVTVIFSECYFVVCFLELATFVLSEVILVYIAVSLFHIHHEVGDYIL